ncbi:MAG: DUF6152 family protein [Pseudomonadota bacterium]
MVGGAPGGPHHSAVAFDQEEVIRVTGTVTRFVWRNPHMAINMEVDDADGEPVLWKIEGPGTTVLSRQGFNRQSLNNGDRITVAVHPLKSGRPGGLLQAITLASGETHAMSEDYSEPANAGPGATPTRPSRQPIPSLVEWVPPPAGETWRERERKTRPAELPLMGSDPRQTGAGALDPDNLAKSRPAAPFDLTGTWAFRGEDEWRANYGSYEFKPHPEFTEKGKKTYAEYLSYARAGRRYREPTAECYPAGMPRLMNRYGSLMMMQYPTAIFMVSRLNNEYRAIWLDGRAREPEASRDPNWNGESIGRWEGDTLVVETTGFTDENHLIQQGVFTGDQLKIIEKISVINDGNTMVMEYIMTDPEHWIGEWRHVKFRDRILRADVREATCLPADNELLPGM